MYTWQAVVIWQGFRRKIRDFVANLKPISIPKTKQNITSSRRLPPLSFRMILDCLGTTILWCPNARQMQPIATASIDSMILRWTLKKPAQAWPPFPGKSKSIPPKRTFSCCLVVSISLTTIWGKTSMWCRFHWQLWHHKLAAQPRNPVSKCKIQKFLCIRGQGND